MPVSLLQFPDVILLGVLEEIHHDRRSAILKRQSTTRNKNSKFFLDEFEQTLRNLSLVHRSWTSPVHRVMGRILMITNVDHLVARNALLCGIFGTWTSMVYLSSYKSSITKKATWTAITALLRTTPNVSSICLEATEYIVADATTFLGEFLSQNICTAVRTVRLYQYPEVPTYDLSMVDHDYEMKRQTENQVEVNTAFYHGLAKLPQLSVLDMRTIIALPAQVGGLRSPHTPPQLTSSTPMTLRGLITTISSISSEKATKGRLIHCVGQVMLCRNAEDGGFRIKGMKLDEPSGYAGNLASDFSCPQNLFVDTESLEFSDSYNRFCNLSPFRALRYLNIPIMYVSKDNILGEMRGMVSRMPDTLEVLIFALITRLYSRDENQELPLGIQSTEIDSILSRIPLDMCPNLNSLHADLYGLCSRFDEPGMLLITEEACNLRNVQFSKGDINEKSMADFYDFL